MNKWIKRKWPFIKKTTHQEIVSRIQNRHQADSEVEEEKYNRLVNEWMDITVRFRHKEPYDRYIIGCEVALDKRFICHMPDLAYAMEFASYRISHEVRRKLAEIDFGRFKPDETYGTYSQRLDPHE